VSDAHARVLFAGYAVIAVGAQYAIASASPDIGPFGAVAFWASLLGAAYLGARSRLAGTFVIVCLAAMAVFLYGGYSSRVGWEALWWMSVIIYACATIVVAIAARGVAEYLARRRHRSGRGG
jgi:hypothetical protein